MTDEQVFLLEEFKESIKTGQWFEESLVRSFKNFAIVFLWNMALVGFFISEHGERTDFLSRLHQHPARAIVAITSLVVAFYALMTIVNMLKTRCGDVARTSRADFLRLYFLRNLEKETKDIYFHDKRLRMVNSSDFYSRPAWSFSSEVSYYTNMTGIIGGTQVAIAIACVIPLEPLHVGLLVASILCLTVFASIRFLTTRLSPPLINGH